MITNVTKSLRIKHSGCLLYLVLRIFLPHLLVDEDAELLPLHRPAAVHINLLGVGFM